MFTVIDNPTAGGGGHGALIERLHEALAARGETVGLLETRAKDDGERLARQAMEAGSRNIVCVGGDGSLSDAVRALARTDATLYVVPCGTGNDFARAFGLPKGPLDALIAQLDGESARIDCGAVNGRPFLNVAGPGFDVEVLRRTEELKSTYPGGRAYRRALLSVLSRYEAHEMRFSVDGDPVETGRYTIIEVCNGQYIGGGMRVAPGARPDDGLFDVVWIDRVPAKAIPLLLPLLLCGQHVRLPLVSVSRAKSVTLARRGMTLNIDGRLEPMDEARFELLAGALRVMRPRP